MYLSPLDSPPPLPRLLKAAASQHPVIVALAKAGRPLNNTEPAKAIGCSPSHASRLRRQVADEVYTYRRGRFVFTSHNSWRADLRWFPIRAETGGLVIEKPRRAH